MTTLTTPLVSTQWLADHLGSDDLLVVEATVHGFTRPNGDFAFTGGHETYIVDGHVPGAVFGDLIDVFSDPAAPLPFTRPSAEQFRAAAGELGIGPNTSVVVYDRQAGQWAARFWWLLRTFGHDNVAVLDGGWTAWTAQGRPTDVGHVEPTPAQFEVNERPELVVGKADIQRILAGDEQASLISATPAKVFDGETGLGHLPGSVNIPSATLVDQLTNTLLPAEQLSERLGHPEGRAVAYCVGGIAATVDTLAFAATGRWDVAVYDGSLGEWSQDPEAELVRGSSQTKSAQA